MTVIVAAPLGVGAKGGCMEVIYEAKNSLVECQRVKRGWQVVESQKLN
jgi:hypothetical protein